LPLVLATGAGASSRKSIGIAVFSGMLASTCLAVLFVPSFFVVVRRFEEWRAARKAAPAQAPPVAQARGAGGRHGRARNGNSGQTQGPADREVVQWLSSRATR